MNDENGTQWRRREGYGGPESFPEDGAAGYAVEATTALAGTSHEIHLADGRVLDYIFRNALLTVTCRPYPGGGAGSDDQRHTGHGLAGTQPPGSEQTIHYRAIEGAPGIFFINHGHNGNERLNTSLALDLNRNQAVVVDAEIPAPGEADYRVRKNHVGGCIGAPATQAARMGPPFPPDLVGKRFVADYGEKYAWEVIYLNDHRVAWHGLRGNPGIGDVEVYHASGFAPGIYLVSWSEEAETLFAAFLYNLNNRTITGHMFGYAPEQDRILNLQMGGRMVDSREYGINMGVWEDEDANVRQGNKDVVLRQHYEVWNQARYDLIEEIYTEDYACHFIGGLESAGREALLAFVSGHRASFPDWTEEVVDLVAEGDRVVSRYVSTGTHLGEFQGVPPTGRKVTIPEVSVYRLENGRIAEQWGFPDGVSLMKQLTTD